LRIIAVIVGAVMELLFPPFRLDLIGERLWQGDREVHLRPKTFDVLRHLAERPGRLVSSADLLHAVWPNVTVSEAMPRLSIRELRAALGDDYRKPTFIETRPGRGYRFMAAVLPVTVPRATDDGRGSGAADAVGLPLVGRQADLDRLRGALERARLGERQVVFVNGEPGIGKTTLIEAFLAGAGSAPWLANGDCIEQYGAGEPYLPILSALERLCRDASAGDLVAVLRRTAPTWLAQMPSLIDPAAHEALTQRLGGTTQPRMLRELAALLEALATERVLVIWLEDLHWADHSTLDAIAFLARRADRARLLLLGTYRPAEVVTGEHSLLHVCHDLRLHGHCQEISLAPLTKTEVTEYLRARLAGAPVSDALVQHVHQRTEGNSLFMVTVVDDLVARALVTRSPDGWSLDNGGGPTPDVPETLRQLIERQLQRLAATDQKLLEAASVAGVEFAAAAVASALGEAADAVEAQCERLARLGRFLKPRGATDWPDGTTTANYTFLHALHQEVLYASIPAGRRRDLHARVGKRLERAFAHRAREVAAELAMHFERGRDAARTVQYHRLTGETALGRAAHVEAIAHLSRALDALPDGAARSQSEIEIQLALGPAWIVAKGYAAPEVERTYTRALTLARRRRGRAELARVLNGLWNYRLVRAELGAARTLANELVRRGRATRDPAVRSRAHAALGETLFHLGKLNAARAQLTRALARERTRAQSREQPRVASYMTWALWMAGYPDQARAVSRRALDDARALGHPHSRTFALGFAAVLHPFCGEVSRVAELVEEQLALCQEFEIPYWRTWAMMMKGWVLSEQGRVADGAATMRAAVNQHRATGAAVGVPHFLALLADLHGRAGQVEDGLRAIDEALELMRRTGNRYFEAEIHGVRGDLLLRRTDDGTSAGRSAASAERCFQIALKIARSRSARSFELRAAIRLARLCRERGETEAARRVLAPVSNWFSEGADTADLLAARRLLAELSGLKARSRPPRHRD
jgi:DNA-binding winged helix-turn-helix (wHTH) protein/predicted ATPase